MPGTPVRGYYRNDAQRSSPLPYFLYVHASIHHCHVFGCDFGDQVCVRSVAELFIVCAEPYTCTFVLLIHQQGAVLCPLPGGDCVHVL